MYASNRNYCDFFIWTKKFYLLQRVKKDEKFLEKNIQKALHYHKQIIMPELLAKWYTKSQIAPAQEAQSIERQLFCYC